MLCKPCLAQNVNKKIRLFENPNCLEIARSSKKIYNRDLKYTLLLNTHFLFDFQVNAGDYILVWGDVDEDGFFDGEMLDGRRGLVPSNFVEKLEGEELFDFHQQVVLGLGTIHILRNHF